MRSSTSIYVGLFVLGAVTCGGTVEHEDRSPAAGSGAQSGTGGTGGSAGSGGSTAGSGASTAGSGGSTAGSGGSTAGSGASTAGTGGTVNPNCPPPPSCNWCGGTNSVDAEGCVTGYICANGVDPCTTSPCVTSGDCPPDELCAPDSLCWAPEPTCTEAVCLPAGEACNCNWDCSNDSVYEAHCEFVGQQRLCDCYVDNEKTTSCAAGAAGAPCGEDCCGFPH